LQDGDWEKVTLTAAAPEVHQDLEINVRRK